MMSHSPDSMSGSMYLKSAGSYSRSASWKMMYSPVAFLIPSLSAPPFPLFFSRRMVWTSVRARTTSAVPSVDPSSTTMISLVYGPMSTLLT